ncbi:MAG: class I SAM-dependent methyltransferase, partial [Acidimicrobiales bacterium]|nr:class I SAM-dependent methyltransferase [Acidimicrobiales bacterium]
MLTVDYERLGLESGELVLDLGCGAGRHVFQSLRNGARVVAFDYDFDELRQVAELCGAMAVEGEIARAEDGAACRGDAVRLPFP